VARPPLGEKLPRDGWATSDIINSQFSAISVSISLLFFSTVTPTFDVGTGTGILAIAAARAGAERVIATDINPNAALSVPQNARGNGAGDRVTAVCMNLLSGLVAAPLFDVIVANLPKHPQEPRDLADRGWHGGPSHRDITPLFDQAYERLKPNGQMYVMFSSHSDLDLIDNVIKRAGFKFCIAKKYSIFIDSFVLYECTRQDRDRHPR
jgi:release factor glutamine methyltransferase